MDVSLNIPQSALNEAIRDSLVKGELGDKVADRLANLYAEITTYNRTDAAKLLNIARSTLHEYENAGLIKFNSNRISAKDLLEFARKLTQENSQEDEETVQRKSKQSKRRKF